MKKVLFSLLLTAICSITLAQSVPNKINYQAIARDANGDVLDNQSLNVTIGILAGSPTGILKYEESHSVTTNQYGLFYLKIG